MTFEPDSSTPGDAATDRIWQYSASDPTEGGISPRWTGACAAVRDLSQNDEIAFATAALSLEPVIGAAAAGWCRLDRQNGQLRGFEVALAPQDPAWTRALGSRHLDAKALAALLREQLEAGRHADVRASFRRVRFSLRDGSLGPVAAANRSPAGSDLEHPMELSRILGDGPWTYWPISAGSHVEAVLCLRSVATEPPGGTRHLRELLASAGWAACRVRQNEELGALERRARVLADLSQRTLSASSLEELLDAAVRASARGLGGTWGTIWTCAGERSLQLAVHCGQNPDSDLESQGRRDQAARCLEDLRPRPLLDGEGSSIGSLMPLHAFEAPLGVIAVAHGASSPDGSETIPDQQFLASVAGLVSLALRNVALSGEVRAVSQRERELQGVLQQSERLATIGETSAHLARQLEAPLNAIGESARALCAGVADDDPRVGQADLIAREARRLVALVREQVSLMQLDPPRLQMVDLADISREAFALVRGQLERAGVGIEERHESGLPELLLDRVKVQQVILRILENIAEGLVRGARLSLRTERDGPNVCVQLASEAEPPVGGIVNCLFLPFGGGIGTAGLGLAVARQVVLDHGGEIQVESDETWPTRFRVSFPIRDNQDRRRPRADRRRRNDRRRAA